MKPAEQEELLAYHMKELPPERMQAVRAALLQDAALLEESNAIAAALAAVKDVPMHVNDAVLARNWAALQPRLKPYPVPVPPVAWRWRMPLLAGAALAMIGGGVFFAVTRGAGSRGEHAETPVLQAGAPPMPPAGPSSHAALAARVETTAPQLHLGSGVYRAGGRAAAGPIHLLGLAAGASSALPRTDAGVSVPSSGRTMALSQSPAVGEFSESVGPAAGPATEAASAAVAGPMHRDEAAMHGAPDVSANRRLRRTTTDVMVGVGGTFIVPHTSYTAGTELTTTTATHAIAALASVHQQFHPALGYRITTSYTRVDLNYAYLNRGGQINSAIYELAGTYVIQGPHRRRLSTSGDAGAALLAFLPTDSDPAVSYGYRPAAVLGVNVDYALTKHLGARLSYRAQLYKLPNFRNTNGTIPVQTPLTLSNDPALGIVYRFGKD